MRISDWSSDVCSSDLFGHRHRMRRSDSPAPVARTPRLRGFPDSAALPLPVYREFIDMLFSMALPIVGFGAVFVGICLLAARELDSILLVILAVGGGLTTVLRFAALRAYRREPREKDFGGLIRWERKSEEATSELQSLMRISCAGF